MWRSVGRLRIIEEQIKTLPLLRRGVATVPGSQVAEHSNEQQERKGEPEVRQTFSSLRQRFVYPEFLPDPKIEWRNSIREKLERMDMMKRRSQVDLPEFYVGSIIAVVSSNQHSASKQNRFLGICIKREGCGLRASFVVRNVIDNIGVEVRYHLYDPTILKIDVIKLEKRLDDELYYLRDALPEYSTFPEDMEPELLPEGAAVPVNTTKVIMKPRPWYARWERTNFQGIDRDSVMAYVSEKMKLQIPKHQKPWEKYDLMKQYRATIPEEEQKEIFAEVDSELHKLELTRKKLKRKRAFVKPKKLA
uniref:Large ribosomal subunit protein bL19m n=2 Tax=Lygus hesperus TaxID=30085 RepID=A0A0A9Y9Y8_LYGHE